jgi:hypothetical protein
MSVLRSLESKIADLVEGTFSRAFRSEVRPIELARKLAREMEEHKSESLSRTYVPNEYTVHLSPQDREHFSSYEDELISELAGYLLEHARRERFALPSQPVIRFNTDERLALGEFGIQARLVRAPAAPGRAPEVGDHGHTMIYSAAERVRRPLEDAPTAQPSVVLVVDGRQMAIGAGGAVIGRSRDCDIVLGDANVSRRHAEIYPDGSGWAVRDLGSTNGVRLNGRRLEGPAQLSPGDRLLLGTTELEFDQA